LRYYFDIDDPDALSDEEWAERWHELQWIRNDEAKHAKKSWFAKLFGN
jgi:hypothetical protein